MSTTFEHIGWYKEYFKDGKYLASVTLTEPDREVIGYYGRRTEILESSLKTSKGTLKKGTEVYTFLYPLSGKLNKR